MLTFEQAEQVLNDTVDTLPEAIFNGLNGGIVLLPDVKPHPEGAGGSLYIMGQYHYDPNGLGRYITIYYGSFMRVYGHAPEDEQIKRLGDVLKHELTHHIEHLAGDKSLEIKDFIDLEEYKSNTKHQ